jgi:drug/metabolite transporter (DMT)-like permease
VLATALILVSALIHATVNAMVKISEDGLLTRGCMNGVALLAALPWLPFVPLPPPSLVPVLLAAVLVHGLYPFFLVAAYRRTDLSVAFPIARGLTPLGVALLSWVALGTTISLSKFAWIAVLALGVAAFAFEKLARQGRHRRHGISMAIYTGAIIATYTVIDGIGLRSTANAFTYIVWLLVLDGLFVSTVVVVVRHHAIAPFLRRYWRQALRGGLLGVSSYALALYALSLGPIAEIAALRETSVAFAAVISALFLHERFGLARIAATTLVTAGVIGMKLGT